MRVSCSLATAAMSPATTSETGEGSLPRSVVIWWSRSSPTVRPLTSVTSVVHGALEHLEQVDPTDVGVDDGLEHERRRGPVADGGRRTLLGDEVGEPVDADEAGRAPAQHREDVRLLDPLGERDLELVDLDGLVGEVPLHEVVVGDDDALDQRVVDRVLLDGHVVGDRPARGAAGVVGVGLGLVAEQVDDATEVALFADGQLERCDARAEAFLELRRGCGRTRPVRGRAC